MMYDIIIIGSGPAGLTASIYALRYKLSNLVIGKLLGGTITYAHKVENYPGIPDISGVELGQKMEEQAKALGAEILAEKVIEIRKDKKGQEGIGGQEIFKIRTFSGKEYSGKTLVVATGTERRKLDVPGEKEYLGKGVSYCTNCDAPFFKGKTVVLVGGSNAACSGAVHLSEYTDKVYLIYRKSELRAEPVWAEKVKSNPKIEVIYETNITKILGVREIRKIGEIGNVGDVVGGVELDKSYNGNNILRTDGVFVEIGGVPATDFIKPLGVATDEEGYIRVNEKMETNIEGIFAAGDVTDKSLILQQTVTACAQGAVASYSAFKYLKSKSL